MLSHQSIKELCISWLHTLLPSSSPGFIYLFIYFYFTILYWFCHTSTCIHHGCTCVPHPEPPSHLPPHTLPLGHPSAPALTWLLKMLCQNPMRSSSFSILYFCLFILFMGFSRQEYWSGLSFPSPVDHVLSELSTMMCPSWLALHDMAHSFIELDKAVVHVIRLVSFLWLWFSVCLPSYGEG